MRPAAIASLLVVASCAGSAAEPAVRIEQAWARATPPSATAGGAYLTLVNEGDVADALVSATCEVADEVELHTHVADARGVLHMTQVERIPLPAHGRVQLKPGGFHLMLFDLKRRLTPGERFGITVRLEHAGSVAAMATVQDAAALAPGPGGDPGK